MAGTLTPKTLLRRMFRDTELFTSLLPDTAEVTDALETIQDGLHDLEQAVSALVEARSRG